MTVQGILNEAVKLIDDYDNITDYNTDYFGFVTSVHSDLMRNLIGINPKEYRAEIPDADTYYSDFPLPPDLTEDSQIISVWFEKDGAYDHVETVTVDDNFYLRIPCTYSGYVTVRYMVKPPVFTALADTLLISDDAVYTVAIFGLAELLSFANNDEMTNIMASKYQKAKMDWKQKNYNKKRIKAVYNI